MRRTGIKDGMPHPVPGVGRRATRCRSKVLAARACPRLCVLPVGAMPPPDLTLR